jgi:hypothetical protein
MNINSLKLSEVADIERLGGRSVSSFADEEAPKGRMLMALVYVFKRRENPNFKFEDAGDIGLEEAMALIANDDDDKSGSGTSD